MERHLCLWIVVALSLIALPGLANHELTGTWSGQTSLHMTCRNGQTLQFGGPTTAFFVQEDPNFAGVLIVTSPIPNEDDCRIETSLTFGVPLSGTLSGTSLSGTIFLPGEDAEGTFMGTVSGNNLTINFSAGSAPPLTGTITLTRTSSGTPDTSLSGVYDGTYNAMEHIDNCNNLTNFSYSGNFQLSLSHFGTGVSGVASFLTGRKVEQRDMNGNCTLVDTPSDAIPFTGTVSGNTITAVVVEDDEQILITAVVNGNNITGNALGGGFQGSFTATRTSTTPQTPPTVNSFSANPTSINAGQSSTLSWTTTNATSVSIDNGVGSRSTSGSVTVTPSQTTTYTLTATSSSGGTARSTATVVVGPSVLPRVAVTAVPAGMLQLPNQATATDSFTVSNLGDAATNITLVPNGDFFTLSTTSFTLAPRSSQPVIIRALARPAGSYSGSVVISGSGVPSQEAVRVQLLVAAPPTAPVDARPSSIRPEVVATADQTLINATLSFTNSGAGVLQGILVADVPWIIPPTGVITINPGQTVVITYQIDRSKRTDAGALNGGASGKLSLVFLGPTGGTQAAGFTPSDSPGSTTVSVTVVDVVKPGVVTSAPPALAINEFAHFVPGLSSKLTGKGDLLLSNRTTSSLSDLRLFYGATGATPTLSSPLNALLSNIGVSFPSVVKNVFGDTSQTGSVQVRTLSASNISVNAVQLATTNAGLYGTALPVLRSDRGVIANDSVVLSGILRDAVARTDLYLQETSGNAGTATIDYFTASGAAAGTTGPHALGPFGFLELTDIPVTAAVARVVNSSTGPARIAAYGVVVVLADTLDRFVVHDWIKASGAASETTIVPFVSVPGGTASTTVMAVNRTSAPIAVTMEAFSSTSRRRPTRGGANSGAGAGLVVPDAPQTVTLAPLAMFPLTIPNSSNGFVRVVAPSGAVAVNGRTTVNSNYGTGLAAYPATAALSAGQSKRIVGVEDSSKTTTANKGLATYRSNLVLVETTGQSATVRVTLRYTFVAGSTVAASAVSSREFTLTGGQFLLLNELGSAIIGNQRDSFGDLRGMQVDIEVLSGSGRVIGLVQSIENATGDVVLRE